MAVLTTVSRMPQKRAVSRSLCLVQSAWVIIISICVNVCDSVAEWNIERKYYERISSEYIIDKGPLSRSAVLLRLMTVFVVKRVVAYLLTINTHMHCR